LTSVTNQVRTEQVATSLWQHQLLLQISTAGQAVQQLITQQQANTQQQQQQRSFQQVGPHNVAWPKQEIAQPSQMLMQVSTDGQAVQEPIAQHQMALQRTNPQQVGTSNRTSGMARTEISTATRASSDSGVYSGAVP
jgi:hypothetical protein